MKCNHCGADIPDGSKFCNVCGAAVENAYIEKREVVYNDADGSLVSAMSKLATATSPFTRKQEDARFERVSVCPHCKQSVPENAVNCPYCAEPIPLIKITREKVTSKSKRKLIREQFKKDKTSICPRCGSHSVKVYRKGYNWQEAFWGNLFRIRGSRYTAGFDSNDAMCFCEHCGHKWNTHYDIRTIK